MAPRVLIFNGNYPRVITRDPGFPNQVSDFTLNYWGDPSGPYHPTLNPEGLGDTVGDSVLFAPWLTDSNITATPEPIPPPPTAFKLEAFPNPFNPDVRIMLTVPMPERYRLEVFDVTGRLAEVLFDGAVVINREVI